MTQVFYSSTFFGTMTLAAALDAGCFAEHTEHRMLIVSANGSVPEIGSRVDETPGFEILRRHFDEIVDWNEIIAPLHPSAWAPAPGEVPLLSRLLHSRLALPDPVTELVVESIAVAPARTIATLIRDCPITVFSDGLMSYGPTRDALPPDIAGRLRRLLYLDLLPAVEPLLLREYGVPAITIPDHAFAQVVADLAGPSAAGSANGPPVIVGQYLSALDILTAAEESALHADMLRALVEQGHQRVVFKPHPASGRGPVNQLQGAAVELSVELSIAPDAVPAEVWFARTRPALVVSCFSTALLTAARYLQVPVATMGCELALERITPYQNSNRVPVTIVDATVPRLRPTGELTDPPRLDVAELVLAVGYCMQSRRHPALRSAASAYLDEHGPARYFKKRRLEAVGLATPPLRRSAQITRIRWKAARGWAHARRAMPDHWSARLPELATRRR